MVKVTPHDNLVPCTRDSWVKDCPAHDLINNYLHAKKLIRAAAFFFQLRRDAVIYSGYIRDRQDGFFTINLWHEDVLVRSLILSGLGYSGALHAETVGGRFEDVVGWDMLATVALDRSICLAAAVA